MSMSFKYLPEVPSNQPIKHKPATLYGNIVSNHSRIAQIVAQVAGLFDNKSVAFESIDFSKGQHKAPEFLKINPLGRVPVFVDSDFVLHESRAIGLYLANTYARYLYPELPKVRAKVDQALFYEATSLGPAAGGLFWHVWLAPNVHAPFDLNVAKTKHHELHTSIKYVEEAFFADSNEFLAGTTLTVADLFIFVQIDTVVNTISNFDISQYKKVNNWYRLMQRREGVQSLSKLFVTVCRSIAPAKAFDPESVEDAAPAAAVDEAAGDDEAAAEEPAAEEDAPAEEAAEEPAAEEDDGNISFDDLGLDDDGDDAETKAMFEKQKDLVKDIHARQSANAAKAKSNLTLDVKPFDSETDMGALEKKIRGIEMEGLKWLGGQLVDVAYGIKKLRIMCQLVDVLINPDSVREEVEKFDDEVQSTDVFAFQMA